MINEGIHERLLEVFDEFDRHSRITNTQYSIDADHYNLQGYRILKCLDLAGFLRHICNFIKDKWITLEIDGKSICYDDLNDPKFALPKIEQPVLTFTLKSIQERDMLDEEQLKSPTKGHTLKQAQFPSSNRRHKDAFTYKGAKAKKTRNFADRLDEAISEEASVQFSEPEILFTQVQGGQPIPASSNAVDMLQGLRDIQSETLHACLEAMAAVEDGSTASALQVIATNCAEHIKLLDGIDSPLAETILKEFNYPARPARGPQQQRLMMKTLVSEIMASGGMQSYLTNIEWFGSSVQMDFKGPNGTTVTLSVTLVTEGQGDEPGDFVEGMDPSLYVTVKCGPKVYSSEHAPESLLDNDDRQEIAEWAALYTVRLLGLNT